MMEVSSHTARPRALKWASSAANLSSGGCFIPYGSTESTEIHNKKISTRAITAFHPIRLDREH